MADTEKITINISVVDLGRIDLLVEQGFYSTRTDLIRTALRNQIAVHSREINDAVARRAIAVGVMMFDKKDLERYYNKNEQVDIRILGMFILDSNVTPELALATIRSIKVFGVFRANKLLKKSLADRIV